MARWTHVELTSVGQCAQPKNIWHMSILKIAEDCREKIMSGADLNRKKKTSNTVKEKQTQRSQNKASKLTKHECQP